MCVCLFVWGEWVRSAVRPNPNPTHTLATTKPYHPKHNTQHMINPLALSLSLCQPVLCYYSIFVASRSHIIYYYAGRCCWWTPTRNTHKHAHKLTKWQWSDEQCPSMLAWYVIIHRPTHIEQPFCLRFWTPCNTQRVYTPHTTNTAELASCVPVCVLV